MLTEVVQFNWMHVTHYGCHILNRVKAYFLLYLNYRVTMMRHGRLSKVYISSGLKTSVGCHHD